MLGKLKRLGLFLLLQGLVTLILLVGFYAVFTELGKMTWEHPLDGLMVYLTMALVALVLFLLGLLQMARYVYGCSLAEENEDE